MTFSARIRADQGTDEETIQKRVDVMIKRLGLEDCQHTFFGGDLVKGLSGGEKKRTTIGYELISDPSLVFLDEPTSGLDSHTAFKICRLLKKEARRGISVVATIHQPSSQIFYTFDRVILLADGFTIYNGKTKDVLGWLNNFGYKTGLYSNPADTLLKLAHDPKLINAELDIVSLGLDLKLNYKQPGPAYDEYVAQTYSNKLTKKKTRKKISRC